MKLVIVGGVAGGMSAAARARRLDEQAQIIVFEAGNFVSFANCGLPYHLGGEIGAREDLLLHTPQSLHDRANLDIRLGWKVTDIDRAARQITAEGPGGEVITESYEKLLLAPGTHPVIPPIPGLDSPRVHTLRTIDDMDGVLAAISRAKSQAAAASRHPHALVVGAGFIGLEAAEALVHQGLKVTLVEAAAHILPPLDRDLVPYLERELVRHGLTVRSDLALTGVQEIPAASPSASSASPSPSSQTSADTETTSTEPPATSGDSQLRATFSDYSTADFDFLLLAVGARPRSELAKRSGLQVDEQGHIVVDASQRTSDPYIYAVGDATAVTFSTGRRGAVQLAGPANRQGRRAADAIFCRPTVRSAPVLGTAVVRVFDQVAALTGATREWLEGAGVDFETIRIHPADHATYFPGARPLHLMGYFEKGSGRLLGAAGVGHLGGIDKRIDVLATAIRAGMSAGDLAELELAYSPPVGAAKDPVNMLGFTAWNVLSGFSPQAGPEQVGELVRQRAFILDVRSQSEREKQGIVPGSMHVPLPTLREHIEQVREAAGGRPIYVHCFSGVRSYLAVRILIGHGMEAINLAGGWESLAPYVAQLT